jgi:DNA polymerase I-like protein with 3'-5' exonuclease and polymerase domains
MSKFTHLASKYIVQAGAKSVGLRLVFDIEANGLLDTVSAIHCVVIADLDSDQINEYGPDQISAALDHLKRADYLVGHNITGYDLPLLQKLHQFAPRPGCTIVDTLVASRLILPNIEDLDDKAVAMGGAEMGKLRGRHSIEAWGIRLGVPKVGADIDDWSKWTPEMQARCVGDISIGKALWQFLQPDGYSPAASKLEHRAAAICNQITTDGVLFDVAAANKLQQAWEARCAELAATLQEQFPDLKPTSRQQIGALLESKGWISDKRTPTGKPSITNEILETIPDQFPDLGGLGEYLLLRQRLGSLAYGKEAWTKHVGADGHIHAPLLHIGQPHYRASIFKPNLHSVPNSKKGSAYGDECRSLFCAPDGWSIVASDQANLQDRALAHYLHAFDGGRLSKAFIDGGDQHWPNAIALGLIAGGTARDKESKLHTTLREGAKRFRYAFLFGSGTEQLGTIIYDISRSAQRVDPAGDLLQRFFGNNSRPTGSALKRAGSLARKRFLDGTPGLETLQSQLHKYVEQRGWIHSLDGRRLPLRSQHTALNYLLVCAEAIICKHWLVQVHDELCSRFRYGWDGDVVICLWVHDELVACCRSEIADQVGEIMVRHAKAAGEFYDLKVPLDAEYKVGKNWAGGLTGNVVAAPSIVPAPVVIAKPLQASPAAMASGDKIVCPFHNDSTPSLQIYADGHYHCYGCGAHGDVAELPDTPPAPTPAPAPTNASHSDTETLRRGFELWESAVSISDTLAERYLRDTRKLDLSVIPDIGASLRFHPRCPYNGGSHPCLIALFRDAETDEVAGIHRIALTDEADKIGRMMLGSWPQARAIKLRVGNDRLIVGEGIETTIAGAMRRTDTSSTLWAMGSSGSIGKLPIVSGFAGLTVLVDREASNVGLTNARACAERWRHAGRAASLAVPHQVKADFNDLVKGKAEVS